MAGKINGVGGKIEEGEDPFACIVREVEEETGLVTSQDQWIYLGAMGSDVWRMDVFTLVYHGNISDAKSADKERVEWFDVRALPPNIISNLSWLVPLALDRIRNREFQDFSVKYNEHI